MAESEQNTATVCNTTSMEGVEPTIDVTNTAAMIRNQIPLRVKKWNDIEKSHPGTMAAAWLHLKQKFPEISEQDKVFAMKQVEDQYTNRRYILGATYRKNKPRPKHIAPEDWQWLIRNVWTDEAFVKRSRQNSINRAKQEIGSKVGTQSIAPIAYELRNPETGEWPTAMEVWKATYKKADEMWSIPNGEDTLVKPQEVVETHQEKISSAPVPLVEHFALVLSRKSNHSQGVGVPAVNRVAEERLRLRAQVEAAEQRAVAAQQRANVAEEHAQAMEDQIQNLVESNSRLHEEQQAQRGELSSQRRTVEAQSAEVERLVKEQLDQHLATFFACMAPDAHV